MQGCDVPELGAVLIMEDITPYKKVGLTGLADENARRYTEVQERVSRLEKQKDRLERQKEQYWWQSTHDDLTRVFNYRHFQSLLVQEVARAQRYDHPLAVLMIDVDDFKAYNDSYGHLAGDRVLRNVAVIFQGRRRQTDQLARYGGEEFAMILPETNAEGALALAERLRMAVERGTRNNSDFHRPITVSIGVAVSPPDDPQELVKRADERMYRAKVAGKNRVCGLEETSPTV
jgi:diguanylate cyclase (GGDEF)-like protein